MATVNLETNGVTAAEFFDTGDKGGVVIVDGKEIRILTQKDLQRQRNCKTIWCLLFGVVSFVVISIIVSER